MKNHMSWNSDWAELAHCRSDGHLLIYQVSSKLDQKCEQACCTYVQMCNGPIWPGLSTDQVDCHTGLCYYGHPW